MLSLGTVEKTFLHSTKSIYTFSLRIDDIKDGLYVGIIEKNGTVLEQSRRIGGRGWDGLGLTKGQKEIEAKLAGLIGTMVYERRRQVVEHFRDLQDFQDKKVPPHPI